MTVLALGLGHATLYNVDTDGCNSQNPPKIRSYHFHLNFMEQNSTELAMALEVRDNFQKRFANELNDQICEGLFEQP